MHHVMELLCCGVLCASCTSHIAPCYGAAVLWCVVSQLCITYCTMLWSCCVLVFCVPAVHHILHHVMELLCGVLCASCTSHIAPCYGATELWRFVCQLYITYCTMLWCSNVMVLCWPAVVHTLHHACQLFCRLRVDNRALNNPEPRCQRCCMAMATELL